MIVVALAYSGDDAANYAKSVWTEDDNTEGCDGGCHERGCSCTNVPVGIVLKARHAGDAPVNDDLDDLPF